MPPKKSKTSATRHSFRESGPERDPQRESVFQIVVNTQYMPKNSDDANRVAEDLQDVLDAMLTDDAMGTIIRHLPASKNPTWDAIDEIDAEHSVEIGGKFHRLHAQVVVVVKHHSKIHLDRRKIEQFFRLHGTQPEVRNLAYVHIQGSSSERAAREYVRKGIHGHDYTRR